MPVDFLFFFCFYIFPPLKLIILLSVIIITSLSLLQSPKLQAVTYEFYLSKVLLHKQRNAKKLR